MHPCIPTLSVGYTSKLKTTIMCINVYLSAIYLQTMVAIISPSLSSCHSPSSFSALIINHLWVPAFLSLLFYPSLYLSFCFHPLFSFTAPTVMCQTHTHRQICPNDTNAHTDRITLELDCSSLSNVSWEMNLFASSECMAAYKDVVSSGEKERTMCWWDEDPAWG